MTKSKSVANCAMLVALAMIFSYVESLVPMNFGIPGVKLGIANLVTVTGLYYLKPQEVLAVVLMRILLVGFLFGSGMSILYSLVGGIFSFLIMAVIKRMQLLSITGVSILGGISHNIGQILVAACVVHNMKLMYYLPQLLIAGTLTGTLIGMLAGRLLPVVRMQSEMETT